MSLASNVLKIEKLHFARLINGRRITPKFAVVYGERVVLLFEDGRVWTNCKAFREYFMLPGGVDCKRYGLRDFLKCLIALKIIKRADFDKHMKFEKRASKIGQFRSDQSSLDRILKRYGLKSRKLPRQKF